MPDKANTTNSSEQSWGAIEAPLEVKYGLPAGGLSAIRTCGGTPTPFPVPAADAPMVYRIMPVAVFGVLARYGVNAFSGPVGAAEAAALILRDGIRRAGSWKGSVTQYIGGTDPAKHGKITRACVGRAIGTDPEEGPEGDDSGVYVPPPPPSVYEARTLN